MEVKKLKALINDAIRIAEGVPEPYKQKCFGIVLTTFLQKELVPVTPRAPQKPEEIVPPLSKLPLDVMAFFQQEGIPEVKVDNLFLRSGTDIRTKYKIKEHRPATAQIQLALLIALENALKGDKFEFSMETVKERCKEKGFYDSSHFSFNFKNNSKLFTSLSDKKHVGLSPDGKTELAEVISEIAK